jgi:hypothetical protein
VRTLLPSVSYSRRSALAFDADLRTLLARYGVLTHFTPRLDAMPFGSFLAFAVLHELGLGGEREGRDGLPTRDCFHSA